MARRREPTASAGEAERASAPASGGAADVPAATQKPLTAEERRKALEFLHRRKTYARWFYFTPYPKQREFLALGADKRERLLMAGNRIGKTETGAFEATCHMLGTYPPWWTGKRFDRPTKGWVCGETGLAVRDVCQEKLCGAPGVAAAWGTGMIPKDALLDKSMARGVTDSIDTIQVRHVSGGVSVATFKSYEQGREKFQGAGLDWVWFDEEPPIDVYSEGLTRIGERDGVAWMTFTPMKGPSAVVLRFTDEPSSDRGLVTMTLSEIPVDGHISAEARKKIEDGYLPYERDARVRGIPLMGSGRVFTVSEELITEPPLTYIPDYWVKLWGIDIGIGHPFAAVLIVWDKDNDVIHVHHCLRMSDGLPINHWAAMKPIGAGVPVAWPKDAGDREKGSGEPIIKLYKAQGARVLDQHATWEDGGVSTEAGIMEMDARMRNGKFKVAAQLANWFEEYRFYHRKDGQIVKLKDDLLSATRIAIMMKRFASKTLLGGHYARSTEPRQAQGLDFDLHTGM